jgi:hypothetical protein
MNSLNMIVFCMAVAVIVVGLLLFFEEPQRDAVRVRINRPSEASLDQARRVSVLFARWAGEGATLSVDQTGRWVARMPIGPGEPSVPLAISAPASRPDLALLDALHLLALQCPPAVTRISATSNQWCVRYDGSQWVLHRPCDSCGGHQIPLAYHQPQMTDIARLAARDHRRSAANDSICNNCAATPYERVSYSC